MPELEDDLSWDHLSEREAWDDLGIEALGIGEQAINRGNLLGVDKRGEAEGRHVDRLYVLGKSRVVVSRVIKPQAAELIAVAMKDTGARPGRRKVGFAIMQGDCAIAEADIGMVGEARLEPVEEKGHRLDQQDLG